MVEISLIYITQRKYIYFFRKETNKEEAMQENSVTVPAGTGSSSGSGSGSGTAGVGALGAAAAAVPTTGPTPVSSPSNSNASNASGTTTGPISDADQAQFEADKRAVYK